MKRLMHRLSSLPKAMVVVLALGLLSLIGSVDYTTGRDFYLSAFYLLPICWVAWAIGRGGGVIMAIISAAVWLIADLAWGYVYHHPLLPYWNAFMLLVLFLVVAYCLASFRAAFYSLKAAVCQRTAAVQELQAEINERKRLEVAKLQAERLAVVGQMAAQVAHEVRNPLGSITLNLDLLRREVDVLAHDRGHSPNEGRVLIKDIREEVQRIGRVVEDYLQFARLPKLQRRPVDLNSLLEEKLAFLSTEIERANVKLQSRFDPALTTINASPEQLWQAVLNLIRNSCEAMPGGGELTIGTRRDGGQALLLVNDNGKGMTEEQRQNVFSPFFTTKENGLGLGMALVHQIVTEHGGHIECASIIGKGSTFTVYLPMGEKS